MSNCSTPTLWCGFWRTCTILTHCAVLASLLFERPKYYQSASALIATNRLSWLIRMLWLPFTCEHMFWAHIWSQKLTFWRSGQRKPFFKRRESRIKRKVWNEKWCSTPAKLYPHILIKRLHNGWPKKHKRKRRNSKGATCWCRANWSAAHRLSKASENVKSTTDLSLSPLMWSNRGSFPGGAQRKRGRESEWELWCTIGSRPPAAQPSSEHKTTCCLSSFLPVPQRGGKDEELAVEERVAGQTVRGKGSKGPRCPGEGDPLLQKCPHQASG